MTVYIKTSLFCLPEHHELIVTVSRSPPGEKHPVLLPCPIQQFHNKKALCVQKPSSFCVLQEQASGFHDIAADFTMCAAAENHVSGLLERLDDLMMSSIRVRLVKTSLKMYR